MTLTKQGVITGIELNKSTFIGSELYTISKTNYEERLEQKNDLQCFLFADNYDGGVWVEEEKAGNEYFLKFALYEMVGANDEQGDFVADVEIELEDHEEENYIIKNIEVL